MQHESLFSVELDWKVELGPDNERLVVSEGRCEGAISGTFRCSAIVGTSDPFGDIRATIDTDDGATVHFRRSGGWIDLGGVISGAGYLEPTENGFAVLVQRQALAA
jgi:hypothetical protein